MDVRKDLISYLRCLEMKLTADVINYRLSPRAWPQENLLFLLFLSFLIRMVRSKWLREKIIRSNKRLRELNDCDLVGNINGGDSFSDIYGLGRFILGTLPTVIIVLLNKKLILFPQTYGPYNAWIARIVAKWVILRSSMVLSRDRDSITLINDQLSVHTELISPDSLLP